MSEHDETRDPARPRTRRRALAGVAFIAAVAFVSASGGAVWASHQFSDVPNNHPFHDDIDWMADFGITDGYLDGTFKPERPVTRGELAAFMRRFSGEIEVAFNQGTYTSASTETISATCPAGKRAIAGGGATTSTDMLVISTNPSITNNGWIMRWKSDNNVLRTGTSSAYALCVPRL